MSARSNGKIATPLPTPTTPPSLLTYLTIIETLFEKKLKAAFPFSLAFAQLTKAVAGLCFGPSATLMSV